MGNIPTVPVEELRQNYPEIYGNDTSGIPTESFSQPSSELRQNEAPTQEFQKHEISYRREQSKKVNWANRKNSKK